MGRCIVVVAKGLPGCLARQSRTAERPTCLLRQPIRPPLQCPLNKLMSNDFTCLFLAFESLDHPPTWLTLLTSLEKPCHLAMIVLKQHLALWQGGKVAGRGGHPWLTLYTLPFPSRHTEEPQIRKIMPTLVSICGGAEQAAYAIVWRPELLELEAASALRDSLQVRSCVLFSGFASGSLQVRCSIQPMWFVFYTWRESMTREGLRWIK